MKRIKIKIVPASGSAVESWFDFQINNINSNCTNCRFGQKSILTTDCGGKCGNATSSHSGGTVSYTLSINNSTGRIRKPLIVAEGYDVSSIAPLLQTNYSIQNFFSAINFLGGANPTSYDFNNALDNIGSYDLVFIDYKNGTDDIKRNAALLQEVVHWVNGQKQAGDDQNVVMGLSMGGLVARYGLAQMVANGENTQTRLLITHDSPHRGANVPLGIQTAALYMNRLNSSVSGLLSGAGILTDLVPELTQLVSLYNAPATRQMLIWRASDLGPSFSFNTNTFLDGEYRTMVNRAVPYRMIATSQGAECGQQLFAPNTTLVSGRAEGFISPLPWILNNKIKTEIFVNALADQQANRIFAFKIFSEYTILSLVTINITWAEINVNGPSTLPYDGTAGGVYPITNYINISSPQSATWSFLWFAKASYGLNFADSFCFVPTASALDITDFGRASLSVGYVKGLNPGNASRFNLFIGQEPYTASGSTSTAYNEQHVRFTARNSQWMFNEMQGLPNSTFCSTACTPSVVISGNFPANVCGATSATFSVPNAGTVVNYGWSTNSGNLNVSGNANSPSVTINRNAPCVGCTITATYANVCNFSVSKHLNGAIEGGGGYSSSGYPVSGPRSAQCNQYIYYSCPSLPAATNYSWVYPSTWYVSGNGTNNLTLRTPRNSGISGAIGVRVANACDAGGSPSIITTSVVGTCLAFVAFPNPTSNTLTVDAQPTGSNSITIPNENNLQNDDPTTEIYEARLMHSFGNTIKVGESKNGIVKFDLLDVPTGIYYLHIIENGLVIDRKQIIVKK
ncbi:MAG: hypothetical protein JST43_06730 [Bacteroidetes bacterium]|nr:hypothetical protein [Bacteroidota bacterium]